MYLVTLQHYEPPCVFVEAFPLHQGSWHKGPGLGQNLVCLCVRPCGREDIKSSTESLWSHVNGGRLLQPHISKIRARHLWKHFIFNLLYPPPLFFLFIWLFLVNAKPAQSHVTGSNGCAPADKDRYQQKKKKNSFCFVFKRKKLFKLGWN